MVCNNCGEEMTMITDNGRTGYVCLHCGNSFVPSQDDEGQGGVQSSGIDRRK